MTAAPLKALLLGGTAEARRLAEALLGVAGLTVTVSFAGASADLASAPGYKTPARIGGFGGREGLAAYIRQEAIGLVIDATHPFAAAMTRSAKGACSETGAQYMRLDRPPWRPEPEDAWREVADLGAAATALPAGARAFLAVGARSLEAFSRRLGAAHDLTLFARGLAPPPGPIAAHLDEFVTGPPAADAEAEAALFMRFRVTHLVAKNAGGAASAAKLVAARRLGLKVILVARPDDGPPLGETFDDVAAAAAWVRGLVGGPASEGVGDGDGS